MFSWLSWLPWSFWLFFFLPLFDIWASLSSYGLLGATPVLCVFLFTWLVGGWLFSLQTRSVVRRALLAFFRGELPEDELQEAIGLVIAAALLATPGFVTDILGFALMMPRLRLGLVGVIFQSTWAGVIFDFLINPPNLDEDDDDPDPARPDDLQRDLQPDED